MTFCLQMHEDVAGMLNLLIGGAKRDGGTSVPDDRVTIQNRPEQWAETDETKGRRDKSKSCLWFKNTN